jgi:hypothetical protein
MEHRFRLNNKESNYLILLDIIVVITAPFFFDWGNAANSSEAALFTADKIGMNPSHRADENLSNQSGKILVAIMRSQNRPIQPHLVDLFQPFLRSTDYLITHPDYVNWNFAMMLPGVKGVEFFSLAQIQANAAILKAKGATFISYDLETSYSPANETSDPVASMRQASVIAHENGLKLIAAPSHLLTDKYYSAFARVADVYILQAQAYQSNSSQYKSYVDSIVPKLRASHSGMPVITELSTARGDLKNMEQSFSSVASIVDGVTSWYANRPDALAQLNQFLGWFEMNYR